MKYEVGQVKKRFSGQYICATKVTKPASISSSNKMRFHAVDIYASNTTKENNKIMKNIFNLSEKNQTKIYQNIDNILLRRE